jgi:uncharacterized protein (TIGR03086 family)
MARPIPLAAPVTIATRPRMLRSGLLIAPNPTDAAALSNVARMSEIADRYRRVAADFTRRVESVPPDAWENDSPCEGWVARDVVAHLVDWLSAFFFGMWAIDPGPIPPAAENPRGAWAAVDHAIQAALDDPSVAAQTRETPMGVQSFEAAVDQICTPDVLVHTWDLARATGLDDTLDAAAVHRFVESMGPADEAMRASGHFGPKVDVPDDADEQTRLIAFMGRQP